MISMFDYRRGLADCQDELRAAFDRVLASGALILGPETQAFEREFAAWLGAPHVIGVSSGTAALVVAMKACGVTAGSEVVTVANTCPPTLSAIRALGATPVFVDVDPDTLLMDLDQVEAALGERTSAVVPVHLWGNAVDMTRLMPLARRHGVRVIEDCAQAAGASDADARLGTAGDAACFSFYPTKNLGAYGDAGAVATSSAELADRIRALRMYGYRERGIASEDGFNARINELQAAFLRVRLARFDADQARRAEHARRLRATIPSAALPGVRDGVEHGYHQFVVRTRSRADVTRALDDAGIGWGIHYDTPVHRMPAFEPFARDLPVTEAAADSILSLPVHEHLNADEVERVADVAAAALRADLAEDPSA